MEISRSFGPDCYKDQPRIPSSFDEDPHRRCQVMATFFSICGSIGAAVYGILALITDFRAGNVTRRAKLVIIGIAAAAALSLLGEFLSQREAESEALQRQDQLIRSMWRENSKIDTGTITALVKYSFSVESAKFMPQVFQRNWQLTIRGKPQRDKAPFSRANMWSSRHLLQDPELEIEANVQNIDHRVHQTVDTVDWTQLSIFSQFTGKLGSFSNPLTWNGASVEAHLTASGVAHSQWPWVTQTSRRQLDPSEQFEREIGNDNFVRHYGFPSVANLSEEDYSIKPLPVTAVLTLYVRDRPVASSRAKLARVWEHDEDVRNLHVFKFPIVEIGPGIFQGPPEPNDSEGNQARAASIVLTWAGWFLIFIGFTAFILYWRTQKVG